MDTMCYKTSIILLSLVLVQTMGISADALQNSGEVSVHILEEAQVTGRIIYLGNIATIEASDAEYVSKLKDINISSAAEPGFSQIFYIGFVKSRMRQQGFSPENIIWSGSERTLVKTKSLCLSPQEIQAYAEKFIHETRNGKGIPNQSEVASSVLVQPVNEIRSVILPHGEIAVNVEVAGQTALSFNSSICGIVPLKFTISVDDQLCEKRVILFKVEILKEVILAAHTLDKHKIIEANDLRRSLRDVGVLSSFYTGSEALIGKRAKRMIHKDELITSDMVDVPPIINRGDIVTIVIESPAFRISTQGKSREDGIRGQIIRVVNTLSMKEIAAQVVNEKLVRVMYIDR